MKRPIAFLCFAACLAGCSKQESSAAGKEEPPPTEKRIQPALDSIETGYTVSKVRTARGKGGTYIVASSYEGTLLGIGYDGGIQWENKLSGFMNHDLWCADITGDGVDEVLAANADGSIYCVSGDGGSLWTFRVNDAPMYSVSVVKHEGGPLVVCGGFDKNLYYLSAEGKQVKAVAAHTYSEEKPWNWGTHIPPSRKDHTVNFVRPVRKADGSEIVALLGQISQTSSGSIYEFKPLEDKPYRKTKLKAPRAIGSFTVSDVDANGNEEILLGSTGMKPDSIVLHLDPDQKSEQRFDLNLIRKGVDGFGYRVVQPEIIPDGDSYLYYVLFGSQTLLVGPELDPKGFEILSCKYSFNDMCRDSSNNFIVLASAQSGGSCVHVVNLGDPGWKEAYTQLSPPGKISTIIENTAEARTALKEFTKPEHERDPLPVYLMSESLKSELPKQVADRIRKNHKSPVFLGGKHQSQVEVFDRSFMEPEKYQKKRDRRKKYTLTQDQVIERIVPEYDGVPGIAYWGGHGNDPNYYQLSTTKKIMDAANGKKTVIIFPEIQDPTKDFEWLMNYLVYPIADHAQKRNGNLYIRSKYNFWHGDAYLPAWEGLMNGDYADVFVPALEETSCKAMEQSVAARLGIWASGAVNSWGARCARDNTSFDRTREHSHQMLPNHFLRQMVYNISSGAQFIDNFSVDQDYMSFLWEMIAQSAIYVPKRSEIVSFSPVHLGMTEPDEHFVEEGASAHWTVFYDEKVEAERPMVFSRMNGSWKGAPVTEWDFSRFAAGVKERRLNFLPPYSNGTVLISPPQHGAFAKKGVSRGAMRDHLHPIYKDILKEFITDGRHYFSSDGKQTYPADEYYKTVESEIKAGAAKLPLTVTGEVAWVAAQTSPTHLRLTLIDGGYLNPEARRAKVTFHTVSPKRIVDLLSGQEIADEKSKTVEIEIPCGLFRFIDIELEEEL